MLFLQDSNLTSSILTLRVSAENDGAELTCRATNPWFNGGALEEKRIINVACKFLPLFCHSMYVMLSQITFTSKKLSFLFISKQTNYS